MKILGLFLGGYLAFLAVNFLEYLSYKGDFESYTRKKLLEIWRG